MLGKRRQRPLCTILDLEAVYRCFTIMYASRSWTAHVDGRWVSLTFVSINAYRSSSDDQATTGSLDLRRACSFFDAVCS